MILSVVPSKIFRTRERVDRGQHPQGVRRGCKGLITQSGNLLLNKFECKVDTAPTTHAGPAPTHPVKESRNGLLKPTARPAPLHPGPDAACQTKRPTHEENPESPVRCAAAQHATSHAGRCAFPAHQNAEPCDPGVYEYFPVIGFQKFGQHIARQCHRQQPLVGVLRTEQRHYSAVRN